MNLKFFTDAARNLLTIVTLIILIAELSMPGKTSSFGFRWFRFLSSLSLAFYRFRKVLFSGICTVQATSQP